MVLDKSEYEISDDGKKITITKECLENLRNHYHNVSRDTSLNHMLMSYYSGKADVCCDILKMFEPLEG